jgi:biotin operon repressor
MNDDLDAGLWLSISDIAEQKGKSRQAIHKRVTQLEAEGKVETRPGANGTKLVNLAQYDRAVGETGDAFKEAAAETRAENDGSSEPSSPVLRDHQSRNAQYSADLKYLELEERLGRLVPIEEAKEGGIKIGEAVVKILGRLPTFAEQITAAAVRDGVAASRALLKDIERDMRTAIAAELSRIAGAAVPASIEPENLPA